MALVPASKLGLTVARDLCDLLLLLLILASIISRPEVVLPFLALVVLYLSRVRGALQRHSESFTAKERSMVFFTRCVATVAFLLGSAAYALSTQNKLVWIFLGVILLIGPVSLYTGYRDLYIDQT